MFFLDESFSYKVFQPNQIVYGTAFVSKTQLMMSN